MNKLIKLSRPYGGGVIFSLEDFVRVESDDSGNSNLYLESSLLAIQVNEKVSEIYKIIEEKTQLQTQEFNVNALDTKGFDELLKSRGELIADIVTRNNPLDERGECEEVDS